MAGKQVTDTAESNAEVSIANPYVQSLTWLGRRVASALECTGRLSARDEKKFRLQLGDGSDVAVVRRTALDLFTALGFRRQRWRPQLETRDLPAVALCPDRGYCFVYEQASDGAWLIETSEGRLRLNAFVDGTIFQPLVARNPVPEAETAKALFAGIAAQDRRWIPLAATASALASVLVLATSLYSMQVYDRVIGQNGVDTLIVLTVGAMLAIFIELVLKMARSLLIDRAVTKIDLEAAVGVFRRVVDIRLDQFPASLGTLAAQVRGFETVRGFLVSRTIYLATDAPFAVFFLVCIMLIGGPAIALVPGIAFVVAAAGGLVFRKAILMHSAQEMFAGNKRQGLLVETIQSMELLKAAGAGWLMRSRWQDLSHRCTVESSEIKRLNEFASYFGAMVQQVSYIGLVAAGAYLAVTSKSLTTGAIIACSIMSGRVLTPVAAIPGLLVQWANSKISMKNLEQLFELERDNHGQSSPLVPERLAGDYKVTELEFAWPGQPQPLGIKSLVIKPGERVAIIGAVGAGKSTLLKLLAGVVKPSRGLVTVDGLDIHHVAADRRAELVGYLPQATRLVSGTLRDNLALGVPHISDLEIMAAARRTGLADLLAGRPEGLDLPITEGGEGLSRGQKQIVGLTRLLLAEPSIWLLDEPTASMDDGTEQKCLEALRQAVKPTDTFILVTHKTRLLELVDRLIVLGPGGILVDGPKQAVFDRIQQPRRPAGGVAVTRPAPVATTSFTGGRA